MGALSSKKKERKKYDRKRSILRTEINHNNILPDPQLSQRHLPTDLFLGDRFDASIGTWQDGKILDKKKICAAHESGPTQIPETERLFPEKKSSEIVALSAFRILLDLVQYFVETCYWGSLEM
ncbi:hypothetical protein CEXT_197631 [Caerostris extrusa]|uniref:Uncharacterized protein n=1 Tax=Caerostris extrusa TaxID=172846 RepID=A0AAV4NYK4_CAEEX|nr:hypothetical protein CEXT_197631 [Caerostris extrusa]